ncbi:MAG: WecB/TagA/CpsF family glycosyltransferase [Deltaproteobacteria bacterium]|nr:WecB/TagA/CpsF family glycosyltransferase [Deltaproteobacteria bacterium]
MKPKRINILGVPVDCVNMDQAVTAVDAMVAGDSPQAVIANNPEKVIKAQHDAELLHQLENAGLLIPDGIGIVLAARILGLARMERVPGSELMPAICKLAEDKGYRVFLFGANPEVNQKACEVLLQRYPGLQIVGNRDGYVAESDMLSLVQEINASKAEILFIALGSPKQEMWMEEYLPKLNIRVCQGVGGTFDVIAGHVRRAPRIFLYMHLEWFYRLMANPRRLLRQTALPKFVFQVLHTKLNKYVG